MDIITKKQLPRIAIVTPNYNYGDFIERTFDSILSQNYPNLHYVVIDGGSTDSSLEIIRRYERHFVYWHSRKDDGQADAINLGISQCKGELFNWVNSDDTLTPDSLINIAENYRRYQDSLVAGPVLNITANSENETELVAQSRLDVKSLLTGKSVFHQPGLWWKLERVKELGGLDTQLEYCFDFLLLLRYLGRWPKVVYTNHILANFAVHQASKTSTSQQAFDSERLDILRIIQDEADIFYSYKNIISDKLNLLNWYKEVEGIRRDDALPKLDKVAQILRLAVKCPRYRITHFTAGAIKRVLIQAKMPPGVPSRK